ncbi:uncharacterized protein (TIGR03086 family) [Nocardioides sp. BE266]|uniref:TIGR03086 family metal-binding protein n=1 Tax=Nocardioides sp. BE266 TaxID=2817725 RepID=UPI00285FD3C5|nr:TIGR03086 family metal-binding protein [Nocardioides sp. BE266]MDR7253545.1 uncharacterized protein (TIGR03086 family) [Nocardioides sp. BE266]
MPPVDLQAAGDALLHVADSITDDQLGDPTPCEGRTVSQLIGHLTGLVVAFRAAADKELGPLTDTSPDASGWPEAPDGWREALAERVPPLVEAWRRPEAWEGMTRAGGVDLPGEVGGLVALDELVLHGWDLARATGQSYDADDPTADAVMQFVGGFEETGTPGLFGPSVTADTGASRFEQVLARSGRDPHWSA